MDDLHVRLNILRLTVFTNVKNNFVYQPKAAAPSSKNGNARGVTNLNAGNSAPKQPTFVSSNSQAGQNLNLKFPVKNGCTKDPTYSCNIPPQTHMQHCLREFDSETYIRSGDDVESEEYSSTYDDMSVNRIDVIDVACEEYAQEVLGFSNNSTGGNPTLTSEPIIFYSSLSLTPFEGSDLILEEIEAYLKDDSISSEIDHADFDLEGDLRLIEELLNNDLSSHLPLFHNPLSSSTTFSSPSLTPVETSDVLLEEFVDELALLEPFPPGIGDDDFDPEGDILLLEKFLNDDPSSPLPPKELNFEKLKMIKSSIDDFPLLDFLEEKFVTFLNPLFD
ncbi:hypothetical protein Tco_1173909 [Tanacetum coccineum]